MATHLCSSRDNSMDREVWRSTVHGVAKNLTQQNTEHRSRKCQATPVFLPGESQGRGEPGGLPSMGSHRVGHD